MCYLRSSTWALLRGTIAALLGLTALVAAAGAERLNPPLPPAEAPRSLHLADKDLVIELVAAEPDVVSPVAVSWDEDGRMFVTEMSDYPVGPPAGRIKLLEGFDGSGKVKKATVFADKLPFPTGTLPWKGGVFVTAAPNVWYFKDTRGTGRAGERRVVLTGFHEGNQQLRVNGLLWGLDNWVYGANGRNDGKVRRPQDPEELAVSLRGRDFRFRPDTGEVEAVAGQSQFGLARDDWGNRFPSWNTNPIRHVVLEQSDLGRNPWLASGRLVADIIPPTDLQVYSISRRPTTFNAESVTSFNASCGITIYRGGLLGAKYQGNAFICEPLTNLVQRRVLKPAGPTFVAERGEQGKEFLASTDSWFHPVNLATGPDGALYVVDFYREWIEHPAFVPAEVRKKTDWRNGAHYGRIWRIRPRDTPCPAVPRLSRAGTAELVRQLGDPNGWRRDTAQRLLVERQDGAAVPLLKDLLRDRSTPQGRAQALWILQGLRALDEPLLTLALRDPDAHVRQQALRLCEGRLASSPTLRKAVTALATDGSPAVRFRCALALGGLSGRDELQALARLAARDGENEWARLAIVSGLGETAVGSLRQLGRAEPKWLSEPTAGEAQVLRQIGVIIGARNRDSELADCLALLAEPPGDAPPVGRLALLAGLLDGLSHTPRPWRALAARPPAALEQPIRHLEGLLRHAEETADSGAAPLAHRVLALEVLCRARPEVAGKLLGDWLPAHQPPPLQAAAARGLAVVADPELTTRVLRGWGNWTIATRQEVLHAVSHSSGLASVLLGSVENKDIRPEELDAVIRDNLRHIPGRAFQARLGKVLGQGNRDRAAVVTRYREALVKQHQEGKKGDASRGARLFANNCLTCHQLQGRGHRVGPDLAGIGNRPDEVLVEDLLDPSKELAPDFRDYVLLTKGGRTFTGLLAAETAASVTLRRAEGAEDTVLRTEIEELRTTGKSLMPDGLEQALRPEDLADLLAFLRRPDSVRLPPPAR
jgi:putative membrane-bound dehydrogenase-like protein